MKISSLDERLKVIKQHKYKFGYMRGEYVGGGWGRWTEKFHERSIDDLGTYYEGEVYMAKKGRGKTFGFYTGQSSYSCAIPNIGSFETNASVPVPVIVAMLEIAKTVDKAQGYFQCVTLNKKVWDNINEALPKAGFRKVKSVKSQHGDYMNIIWEWNDEST